MNIFDPIMKEECSKCRSWTKEQKHDTYRCFDENCPAKIRNEIRKEIAKDIEKN
jgi:hypothetical protein